MPAAASGSASTVTSKCSTYNSFPTTLAHARRIMAANIALALAIITLLVPAAITGALCLATVVLIHEAAEILVIGNCLRAAITRTP